MGPLDKQVIRPDSAVATDSGLDIAIYMPWYRALPLTSIERIELSVDGQPVSGDDLQVTVNGTSRTFQQITATADEYWFPADPIIVHAGLDHTNAGRQYRVQLNLGLSIPYILTGPERNPLVTVSSTDKTLTAA